MSDVTDQKKTPETKEELDISKMTREEALAYMGLPADADIKEIEDRFWQMSKKYRGKDDEESMKLEDEISSVFDIATGARDRRLEEEKARAGEPKIFGKTKSEWRNYWEYSWKGIAIGIAVVAFVIYVLYSVFSSTRSAYSILVFGHMDFDETFIRQSMEEQGVKPYIGWANIVVPNDEGFTTDEVENTKFNAMFYTEPCVLISDKESYPYNFSLFKDMSPISQEIWDGLSDKAKEGVVPVYMSERESIEYQNEITINSGIYSDEDILNPDFYDDEPILIGYMVKDPAISAKLGIDCWWRSRETTVLFGECYNNGADDKAVLVITTLLNSAFED